MDVPSWKMIHGFPVMKNDTWLFCHEKWYMAFLSWKILHGFSVIKMIHGFSVMKNDTWLFCHENWYMAFLSWKLILCFSVMKMIHGFSVMKIDTWLFCHGKWYMAFLSFPGTNMSFSVTPSWWQWRFVWFGKLAFQLRLVGLPNLVNWRITGRITWRAESCILLHQWFAMTSGTNITLVHVFNTSCQAALQASNWQLKQQVGSADVRECMTQNQDWELDQQLFAES